ncbi:MAG TPA: hypothetical protein VHI93_06035, partial [Candidatus Thermoplasmatota archaeon]|nr:hypothetical protein [Candidatus Thermoplasmatota archaeon]
SWHRSMTVPAGERVALGVFDGPAHNDYSMEVVAGPLRLERGQQQLGSSYPSWTLDIHEDRIEDRLMVY